MKDLVYQLGPAGGIGSNGRHPSLELLDPGAPVEHGVVDRYGLNCGIAGGLKLGRVGEERH